jgi:small subunit ribosomal protein S26e
MPVSTAPYTRHYLHGRSRGKEHTVKCDGCGREVPRFKTFTKSRGFRISDPAILQQVDRRMIHLMTRTLRYCPSCARHRHVAQPGKSVRKKYFGMRK